ncbi:hypothetical protein XENOCAPTIV_022177 [Xenoophorus captivus]|uniref:Uncharacterized protein n=1 Tax=Xenoophorus captivus TaxID=1517983 RepID=A0ABV0RN87_9TELE
MLLSFQTKSTGHFILDSGLNKTEIGTRTRSTVVEDVSICTKFSPKTLYLTEPLGEPQARFLIDSMENNNPNSKKGTENLGTNTRTRTCLFPARCVCKNNKTKNFQVLYGPVFLLDPF